MSKFNEKTTVFVLKQKGLTDEEIKQMYDVLEKMTRNFYFESLQVFKDKEDYKKFLNKEIRET